MIGLEELLERKPKALSGGQRQRVAMGRAIVRRPKVFLMDEPLSNLDAKLRVQMRSEVARIQHELKATTVYVTHDQVEAMTMGDRVALMRRGVLQQVDTPMNLYNSPANLFVASFIGSPSMNLFEADLDNRNGHFVARIGDQLLRLLPNPQLERFVGRKVALGIRPEQLEDAAVVDRRPERAPPARDRAHGRGARCGADRPPRDRRPARPDRGGQGGRGGHGRQRHRRPRGRRRDTLPLVGRFDAASRAQRRPDDRGRRSTRARCTASTSRPARAIGRG